MSFFTSIGIIVLAMLILGFLQFGAGVFMLFRHYVSGKYSQKRVHDLDGYFMMGAETVCALMVLVVFIVSKMLCDYGILSNPLINYFAIIILATYCMASWAFYFRRGSGTQLFISRKLAKNIRKQCKTIKKPSDAFILGGASQIGDFLFYLPAFLMIAFETCRLSEHYVLQPITIVFCIFATLCPVFYLRIQFHNGKNIADIQRGREKNKNFCRAMISGLFLTIILIIIGFRMIG